MGRKGEKKTAMWLPDAQNKVIKEQTVSTVPSMHPDSDLQVQDLLIRRGLALEVGCVMSYSAHDKLKQRLMTSLTYAPPPGYNKVGYAQVKEADAMFWDLLAQRARGGRHQAEGGARVRRGHSR